MKPFMFLTWSWNFTENVFFSYIFAPHVFDELTAIFIYCCINDSMDNDVFTSAPIQGDDNAKYTTCYRVSCKIVNFYYQQITFAKLNLFLLRETPLFVGLMAELFNLNKIFFFIPQLVDHACGQKYKISFQTLPK